MSKILKETSEKRNDKMLYVNKERFYQYLQGFKTYIEMNSRKNMTDLANNPFFLEQEGYKEEIRKKARIILDAEHWEKTTIGTGMIASKAIQAVEVCGNLVHHQQQLHFKNKINEDKNVSELVLHNIYCGSDDAQAFDDAVNFFGGKYDLLAYLFFIKNTDQYLPIRSSKFDDRFEFLGIPFRTSGQCSSENYFRFVEIMNELKIMMENYYGMEVSLLDAHSVIWQLEIASEFVFQYEEEEKDKRLVYETNQAIVEHEIKPFSYIGKPREKAQPIYTNNYKSYPRSRQIALHALSHAEYCCEINKSHESFIRRHSGQKYMEPHHLIPMAYSDDFDVSLDVEENIVSLCSNCHNEIHYGKEAKVLVKKLYEQRKEMLQCAGIEISLEDLLKMYR